MIRASIILLASVSLVIAQEDAKCGTAETDFAPCVPKDRADSLFQHCCRQYAPEGCQPLCQYETDELAARNLVRIVRLVYLFLCCSF